MRRTQIGMKQWVRHGAAVVALAGAFGTAHADVGDGLRVARSNACMGCHAVDRKLVGPSFKDIAARYKADPQAVAKLSKKVKDGGSGAWGAIPMPAHPRMSDADLRSVVDWVLAGAPSK
ncbi:c-type cytochrome [Burkholderia vietnamiensis]|uniref:c-type cytochrome n=1 Tax=Burkholderia vietnamiensis TaxID=60552 RepID=UPI00075CF3D9|nr:c-type cytochrome [Burkholderia vietnamiensis]KVE72444.1 cytochrome C [Burkholderia vietnamiensis]KVE95679.1 cytochrome C [Burkholderia vietnamiensis]KVE98609.1 cytochrome C [Burkholderia vietnamiensis]KVG12397.1 cytochrome C [Burkholderia vietnamiensis]MBR7920033.1 c-type cytochrome [Burkholderia vietnamiensis]